jgi:preprotein translocase subunit YajC
VLWYLRLLKRVPVGTPCERSASAMPTFETLSAALHHVVAGIFVSADTAAPVSDLSAANGPLAGLTSMVPYLLMFAVIYFLIVRPGSKQRRDHQLMLGALKKDDEVVTSGGVYGRIVALEEKLATVEIADRVKIRILRDRIAGRVDSAVASPTPKK